MVRAIVTICTEDYLPLLKLWERRIASIYQLPIYVIGIGDSSLYQSSITHVLTSDPQSNLFEFGTPDHACFEKLKVFEYLPQEISEILFIDVDILLIEAFDDGYFSFEDSFVACKDLFVGYKEKLYDEVARFDPSFDLVFCEDGSYSYVNTGVFFVHRAKFQLLFKSWIKVWSKYLLFTHGKNTSIFDQNWVNYCLMVSGVQIVFLPVQYNCIRQYDWKIIDSQLVLEGRPVLGYHLNGGTPELKVQRWLEISQQLGLA